MTDGLDRRFVLTAGGIWTAAATTRAFAQGSGGPVVETASGRVRGSTKDGVLVFKGIPYAAPPTGANRFLPPKPVAPWTGVKDVLAYGATALQSPPADGPGAAVQARATGAAPPPATRRYPSPIRSDFKIPDENEDCLFLNVWTPSTTGKRAVMFWMHGGGFSTGSGSSLWYEGVNIARKQDVVIVTINHRLNVFGYCDLSAYGDRFTESGNAGMHDCVAALQWVKQNIGRFGGDPDRILIHGESGGGRKTSMMMGFVPAQGLFHRVVVQSGSALRMDSQERARLKAKRLIEGLGIAPGQIDKIQQLPFADIQRAQGRAAAGLGQWRPVVNGKALPRHPFEPDATPLSRNIPMLIGTNRTEQAAFLGTDGALDNLSDDGLKARLKDWVPASGVESTFALYKRLHPTKSNAELLYMAATDRGYFLDSTIQAERKARAGGAPAYLYSFYLPTAVQDGRYHTPHAMEIPFVFDTLGNAPYMVGDVTAEKQALADKMSATWANFAKTGTPTIPGGPAFPVYNAQTRPTMIWDTPVRVMNDPRGEERMHMLAFGSQQDAESDLNATTAA